MLSGYSQEFRRTCVFISYRTFDSDEFAARLFGDVVAASSESQITAEKLASVTAVKYLDQKEAHHLRDSLTKL